MTKRELLPLLLILSLGAGLRLQWIRTPLVDAHRWRQVDTASVARTFHEERFNIFYPQVNWGGRNAYVEMEFPLLPAISAVLYKVFGPHEYIGRVVTMAFSTAMIAALYGLGRELYGATGGLAAAFLLAVSPAAVFFGRTFMPDSMMLFFWVSGVFAFVRYCRTGSRHALWLGAAAATLACLAKIPAVMMFAPIAGAAWHWKRWTALRDGALLVALAVPLAVTAAWYWHAFRLYNETGLTFGILFHPARTYPPLIAPGPWTTAFSKWSSLRLLASSGYYLTLLDRLYHLLLLPIGFAGALVGAVVWKRSDGRLVADAWLAAIILFVLAAAEANIGHEYYQLPIVPVAALYFGAFARPVFESVSSSGDRLRWVRPAALAAILGIIGFAGFFYSGIINSHFRPNSLDVRVLLAGAAVERVVPPDALVVVADDYGVTSPLLLHFAHRKGWSFDVDNLQPAVIDGLRRFGARYFVTTVWSRIEQERPDAAAYLQYFRRVKVENAPGDTAVFELARTAD
jgi:4-amino-4-deoxy-L-arabinose transferase-like glycosyltransferase